MKTNYKYQVELKDISKLTLPAGSKIISVAVQGMEIVLYALVDTDIQEKMVFSVLVLGTGHEIPFDLNEYTFLGTVSLSDGMLMFHIYYKLDKYLPG